MRRGCVLFGLAPFLMGAATGGPVEVAVTNVAEAKGVIHVELCPERLFLKKCPYAADAAARRGVTTVTIPNVPSGRYAAQAYHDRNVNRKADRNLIGLPTEEIGFSNDAMTQLAAPKFAKAAFDHGARPQRITFKVRRWP